MKIMYIYNKQTGEFLKINFKTKTYTVKYSDGENNLILEKIEELKKNGFIER